MFHIEILVDRGKFVSSCFVLSFYTRKAETLSILYAALSFVCAV